jgi:hypothetical protein
VAKSRLPDSPPALPLWSLCLSATYPPHSSQIQGHPPQCIVGKIFRQQCDCIITCVSWLEFIADKEVVVVVVVVVSLPTKI